MNTKNRMGRPPKYQGLDCPIVQKVLEGLRMDFTVTEACAYAGIARQTFYDWQSKYDDFSDEINRAGAYLSIVAKKCLANALIGKGTFETALKYLERRQPAEYGKRKANKKMQPADVNIVVHLLEGMAELGEM